MDDQTINLFLVDLFKAHDIGARLSGEWVIAGEANLPVSGFISKEWDHTTTLVVQLDIVIQLPDGRFLIESFSSIGSNREAAVKNSLENFVINSFHVISAAFFQQGSEQITIETWDISPHQWEVFIGNFGIKKKEGPLQLPDDLFSLLENLIRRQELHQRIHWFRLFYAQYQQQMTACEVLKDNEPWLEAQEVMFRAGWPKLDEFYSVRNFLVMIRK